MFDELTIPDARPILRLPLIYFAMYPSMKIRPFRVYPWLILLVYQQSTNSKKML